MSSDLMESIIETICLKKNDGLYVIHLDEYVDVGTRWIRLYISNNDAIYFGSFGVEHIPKEI